MLTVCVVLGNLSTKRKEKFFSEMTTGVQDKHFWLFYKYKRRTVLLMKTTLPTTGTIVNQIDGTNCLKCLK